MSTCIGHIYQTKTSIHNKMTKHMIQTFDKKHSVRRTAGHLDTKARHLTSRSLTVWPRICGHLSRQYDFWISGSHLSDSYASNHSDQR
jgi:hypothetical protein